LLGFHDFRPIPNKLSIESQKQKHGATSCHFPVTHSSTQNKGHRVPSPRSRGVFSPRQAVWTKEVSCSTESDWVQPWVDRFVQDCAALRCSRGSNLPTLNGQSPWIAVSIAGHSRWTAIACTKSITDSWDRGRGSCLLQFMTVSFRSCQAFYAG
jgi:hypothetical protein